MGEAKRREREIAKIKAEANAWTDNFSDDQKLIAEIAIRLDERLVRGRHFSGGCYHLAFFMALHLSKQGIEVQPVIGWVNDGLWSGMTSHAWIEFNGRKTDASLTYCEHNDAVPTGGLLIHDRVVRAGEASYSYYQHDDAAAQAGLDWMREQNEYKMILQKKMSEHEHMRSIASNRTFEEYLASAPRGGRYSDLAALIA